MARSRVPTVSRLSAIAAVIGGIAGGSVTALLARGGRGDLDALALIDVVALVGLGAFWGLRFAQDRRWAAAIAKEVASANHPATGGPRPLGQRLAPYAEAVRSLADARAAAILLTAVDGHLTVSAVSGAQPLPRDDAVVSLADPFLAEAWEHPAPVVGDSVPAALVTFPAGTVIAARMDVEGVPTGLVVAVLPERVPARRVRQFGALVRRASLPVDRVRLDDAERRSRLGAEHARRQLSLLVSATAVLAQVVDDPRHAFEEMAWRIVPEHADWVAIDLLDHAGEIERVTRVDAEGRPDPRGLDGAWKETVGRVIRTGNSVLVTDVHVAGFRPPDSADAAHTAYCMGLGLTSWALVPIRSRGLSLGVITVGTRSPRRGLRPSDVAALEDLATRSAVTIERSTLYQETRAGARSAVRRATELLRAIEAAPVITDALSVDEVAARSARQAARVLGADAALVTIVDPARPIVARWPRGAAELSELERLAASAVVANHFVQSTEDGDASSVAVPLPSSDGGNRGALALLMPPGTGVDSEQLALVFLLAQVTSAALEHAMLFEAASRSERRVLAILEATPLAIIEVGEPGKLVDGNPAAVALLGSDGSLAALDPSTAEFLAGLHDRLAGGHEIVDERAQVRRADGSPIEVSVAAAQVADRVLCVLTDVTDRLQMEEELQQKRRMEALGRLAGGIAHDFNNLLTVIIGYADLVVAGLGPDHPQAPDVIAVRGATRRAIALTEQLLTISRRRVVEQRVFGLNAAITELSAMLGRLIGEDVALVTELDEDAGNVRMDQTQFEQVVLNLVVNARDAMPSGGRVTLRTAYLGRGHVELSISDTGHGMDKATLERCFEPFFTTRTKDKGTGLGLATVYGIVDAAGGRMEVESELNVGTTFAIELPRVDEPVSSEEEDLDMASGDHGAGLVVLLAEDDPDVRLYVSIVLRNAGHTVHPADDGAAAAALARTLDPPCDVLVTDVVMPNLGGPELALELREERPELPVVFMSGYPAEDQWSMSGETMAGSVFLSKPFGPAQLLAAVAHVLTVASAL